MRMALMHSPREVVERGERPLVLIIDADQSSRDLYGQWFPARGFDIICACGVLGLSMALRRERPHLIVTELVARDLTIETLFRRLRSDDSTRCIPVALLTQSCAEQCLGRGREMAVAATLPKLGDFAVLCSWVDAVCVAPDGRLGR
jgi:CheY-like chemotaxis protein